jgi:hypothetical protein
MSCQRLAKELNDAELVVVDKDLGLVWAWYGSADVEVLNDGGDVVDHFSISDAFTRKLTVPEVRHAIAAYRSEMFEDEENAS